jgi:hypothetical protein
MGSLRVRGTNIKDLKDEDPWQQVLTFWVVVFHFHAFSLMKRGKVRSKSCSHLAKSRKPFVRIASSMECHLHGPL